MKPSVIFASLLVALSATWTSVSANPKGLGRSAIGAARLKQRPPANFLSHYLPDDRYKIAGGVWKFVSTDLDTYYHVPSSPNMMRQPASRVIGFANARDAEEAGYVADPTDGTAARVAAATQALGVTPAPGQGTPQEELYKQQVTRYMLQFQGVTRALVAKATSAPRPQAGTMPGVLPPEIRTALNTYLTQRRALTLVLSSLRPPARFRRFHSLLMAGVRLGNSRDNAANQFVTNGNLEQIGQLQQSLLKAIALQKSLAEEAKRVGIDPALFR